MIDQEILRQLVPNREPDDDFPRDSLPDRFIEGPERWISAWSAYLRWQLREEASDSYLDKLIDQSGFVATGIFRVTRWDEGSADPAFPMIQGFQFGALLLRGASGSERFRSAISLERGRSQVPIREVSATINLHNRVTAEGCIAAVYYDDQGFSCGITAGHVVQRHRKGDRVPLNCSDCGSNARMLRRAPGLIDAASVRLPCGGPHYRCPSPGQLRPALEGETVHLYLGQSGTTPCTVMASASTPAQIKSAAIPQHFLTEKHGCPGDSGSLIAAPDDPHYPADLIGLYLGEADCEDADGVTVTYGYGLDLKQAADMLGAQNLQGDFHV